MCSLLGFLQHYARFFYDPLHHLFFTLFSLVHFCLRSWVTFASLQENVAPFLCPNLVARYCRDYGPSPFYSENALPLSEFSPEVAPAILLLPALDFVPWFAELPVHLSFVFLYFSYLCVFAVSVVAQFFPVLNPSLTVSPPISVILGFSLHRIFRMAVFVWRLLSFSLYHLVID